MIGATGTISSRGPGTEGARRQRDALEAEGVEVTEGRTGELRVDLKRFGWFPSVDEVRMLLGDDHEEEDGDDESEGHS